MFNLSHERDEQAMVLIKKIYAGEDKEEVLSDLKL